MNGHTNQTHCIHGHPFSVENTYVVKSNGARQCVTCRRIRGRNRKTADIHPTPELSPASLRRLRSDWKDGEVSAADLCERFGLYESQFREAVEGIQRGETA